MTQILSCFCENGFYTAVRMTIETCSQRILSDNGEYRKGFSSASRVLGIWLMAYGIWLIVRTIRYKPYALGHTLYASNSAHSQGLDEPREVGALEPEHLCRLGAVTLGLGERFLD